MIALIHFSLYLRRNDVHMAHECLKDVAVMSLDN